MKKSLSLVFALLLFIALGCSFGGFGKKEEAPTPAPDSTSTDSGSTDSKTTSEKPSDSTSSESGSLTLSNFNKIELGADYEDVVKILGSDGSETSSSSIGGSGRKSYKWEGEKFTRIYANFKDNKVISKKSIWPGG